MNKASIIFFLFFVNIYANEEKDSQVVLWYPIPVHLKQLHRLTENGNLSKCQEFILQNLLKPHLNQIRDCSHSKSVTQSFEIERTPSNSNELPTTNGHDDISVRQGDVDLPDSAENVSFGGGEDKSIESKLITIPHQNFVSVGSSTPRYLKSESTVKPSDDNPVDPLKLGTTTVSLPNAESINEEDLVYNGIIRFPPEHPLDKGDITTRINVTPADSDSDYVTTGTEEDFNTLVKDYMDDGEGVDKPCNCTTLLTKLLRHYLAHVN